VAFPEAIEATSGLVPCSARQLSGITTLTPEREYDARCMPQGSCGAATSRGETGGKRRGGEGKQGKTAHHGHLA
jgi:hypothetical protein